MLQVIRAGRNPAREVPAWLALVVALMVSAGIGGAEEPWARPEASGGRAVAHRAGGVKVAPGRIKLPRAVVYDTGVDGAEPTVGTAEDGAVYYVGADINAEPLPNQVDVVRSDDQGQTWSVVSPRLGTQNSHAVTLDPYIWLDEGTGRLYTIDLTVACSILSFTDDKGETWTTNPLACGRPVNDHQTLFGGPPATSTTVGYPNVLYYCWNDVATSSCSKSIDGGLAWSPTGTPPFAGYEPGNDDEGFNGVPGFCGGLTGHGVVGADGTVYFPRDYCTRSMLAISKDEGLTWDVVRVSDIPGISQTRQGGFNTSVAVDGKGNLYYTFVGLKDRLPYLVVSRDGGQTWGDALMVGAPGVVEANLPTIDAGAPGRMAISYYGTTNSPGVPFDQPYRDTTWNAYITMSVTVFAKTPVFLSAPLNHPRNPLVRDRCGPGRCKAVFDFIDVEIAPDGTPWAALVDHCIEQPFPNNPEFNCVTKPVGGTSYGDRGLVGRLVGGPRLR